MRVDHGEWGRYYATLRRPAARAICLLFYPVYVIGQFLGALLLPSVLIINLGLILEGTRWTQLLIGAALILAMIAVAYRWLMYNIRLARAQGCISMDSALHTAGLIAAVLLSTFWLVAS